jgi:hypothetical protein
MGPINDRDLAVWHCTARHQRRAGCHVGSGGTLTVDNNVTALLIDTNGDILAIEGTGKDGIVVAAYLSN